MPRAAAKYGGICRACLALLASPLLQLKAVGMSIPHCSTRARVDSLLLSCSSRCTMRDHVIRCWVVHCCSALCLNHQCGLQCRSFLAISSPMCVPSLSSRWLNGVEPSRSTLAWRAIEQKVESKMKIRAAELVTVCVSNF